MIVAFADGDPETTDQFAALVADPEPRPRATSPELWPRLMDYHFRLTTKLDVPPETLNDWIASPDAFVYVRVSPGNVGRLQFAANLVLDVLELIERNGGAAALMHHTALSRFAAEVAPYHVAPLFGLAPPETPESWRSAAAELADYAKALRDLRALRLGTHRSVSPPLAVLRTYGDIGLGDDEETFDQAPALAAELSALLTTRLQQIGAWPYPAGELLGTFGRALWSLWRPVTATAPPRQCEWPRGCTTVLSDTAHGNRRYCQYHQKLAARDRAARNRARQRDSLVKGRGSRPGLS